MIYRIAEYIDRIERERPQLYRFMTSIWPLLGLATIAALAAWTLGMIG